jgi:hypothetical protein
MTTLKQALAVATDNVQPPWKASDLARQLKVAGPPFGLRSLINDVTRPRVLVFFEVRPLSILAGISSLDDIRARWNDPKYRANADTLTWLGGWVRSTDASIVYVSKDGQVVGVSGTVGAVVGTKAAQVAPAGQVQSPFNDQVTKGLEDLAQGAAAEAGGIIALGSSGAGLFFGLGIAYLLAGLFGSSPPSPPPDGGSGASAGWSLGDPPDNLSQGVLDELLLLDLTVVPDLPDPGQLPGAGDLGGDGSGDGSGGLGGLSPGEG